MYWDKMDWRETRYDLGTGIGRDLNKYYNLGKVNILNVASLPDQVSSNLEFLSHLWFEWCVVSLEKIFGRSSEGYTQIVDFRVRPPIGEGLGEQSSSGSIYS